MTPQGEVARLLAATPEQPVASIAKLSSRVEHAVAQLPDGQFVSFPRTSRICAAQILAELGDVRERFPTENQLGAEAGVYPVTHASGENHGFAFQ